MYRINKIDYFIGVFLTTIINSLKGVPALFDETKDSKRVEFATDTGEFNVYIKYTTKLSKVKKNIEGKRKNKMSSNVSFSSRDYEILGDDFYKNDKKNLICFVCTNEKLNETYMAVLDYEDGMKCLEKSTDSESRRITVTRIGAEYNFYCYGVGFEEEYIRCPVDCTKFLGLKAAEA
ncbi:hypothetical protein [Tissierella praeacuta]|uniref:hypothetical protein n=1 Tax=Tissierella praeacuta TaxID=43131 RepID=UPI002FDB4655